MRAAQGGGSLAARKMIAQRVYNLEPLQRNRFGAYPHTHSVSPVCPQPIRFAIFSTLLTRRQVICQVGLLAMAIIR